MGGWGCHQLCLLHRPWCGDLLHFPLAALLEPPRYTFPDSSLGSCLAQTSNMVQASLAVAPLKNLCLRHSQTVAARRSGGSKPWFPYKRCHSGEQNSLQLGQSLFCSCLWGWILHWTQIMLRDIDLNHQSSSCLHDHVEGLGGQRSWPGTTCWPQMTTCEHVPLTGDQSMSQLNSQTSVFHTFFGQLPEEGPPLRYLRHWLHHINTFHGEMLVQVDTAGGHGSTSSPPLHQPLPSVTSASP